MKKNLKKARRNRREISEARIPESLYYPPPDGNWYPMEMTIVVVNEDTGKETTQTIRGFQCRGTPKSEPPIN